MSRTFPGAPYTGVVADERNGVATRPEASATESFKAPSPVGRKDSSARDSKPPKPPKGSKRSKGSKPDKPEKRSKASKPPKAEKPARPPKHPKAPKQPKSAKPASSSPREPLAAIALVASLLSATTAGVAAVPALLLARKAKREIATRPGATGLGLARAATVIALVALVAWASVGAFALARTVRPTGVDYASLKAGDCIETPGGAEVRRVDVVACDGPHDAEVFAVVSYPAAAGEAFPGTPALLEFAANACLGQAFVDYVGVPRIRSQLTDYEILPKKQAWSEGRRGLICVVDSSDGQPLTGSVRGIRR